MKETKFQTLFSMYNEEKRIIGNFELKVANKVSNKFYFKNFEDQQLDSLVAAENDGFRWKHSDMDVRSKPFDYSSVPPIPGYIAIKYEKNFYIIRAKKLIEFTENENPVFLDEENAYKICDTKVQHKR